MKRPPDWAASENIDGLIRGRRGVESGALVSTGCLRKQLFSGVSILDGNCADGTVPCRFKNLVLVVTGRIDRFRLAIVIEAEDVRGERLAHRVTDADVVIDPDPQVASHGALLVPVNRQRLQRPEGDARLIFQRLIVELEAGEALGQRLEHLLALDPCQRRAETVMNTRAESDMLVWPASDVKTVGLLELVGI